MKKFVYIFLLLISLFIISAQNIYAATESYLITGPIQLPQPSVIGVGRVLFIKTLVVEYKGGKMIISQNADGTGEMHVGDQIQLSITQQGVGGTKLFDYRAASSNCKTYTPLQPTDLTSFFKNKAKYNVLVRIIDWCGGTKNVSLLYLVNGDLPDPGPAPFLDLPWDYGLKGLSFSEAALSMTSYFDHEYPFLSTTLSEDSLISKSIVKFNDSLRTNRSYSSHDGYDYARTSGATLETPVLAAASGVASYKEDCGACGNAILIDHQNGFQTRYYHLQRDGLVTTSPDSKIPVASGQPIGKIGATGNVIPPGDAGAHIHFMVVHDKNGDGDFEDNIPDGIIDPYGWVSSDPDPWENFTFSYNGKERQGSKSYYLWKKKLDDTSATIPKTGGGVVTAGKFKLTFPDQYYTQNVNVTMQSSPWVEIDDSHRSLGSTIVVTAKDSLGNLVTQFQKAFTLEINFASIDLNPFKPEELYIYSSLDGNIWTKEDTSIDYSTKKATAQLNHLTHFALVGERKDTTSPTTTVQFTGLQGDETWFRSDVIVNLIGIDNEGGLGVDYTMYRVDDDDWNIYTNPLSFTEEGKHTIEFYSDDNDGNLEEIKTETFYIDKTPPETALFYDKNILDFTFEGIDSASMTEVSVGEFINKKGLITITDKSHNSLQLTIKEKEPGKSGHIRIESIQYNDQDPIIFPDNMLSVKYDLEQSDETLKKYVQTWKIDNTFMTTLDYSVKTNKTEVIIKENEEEKTKEKADGMKILKINTDRGTLISSY